MYRQVDRDAPPSYSAASAPPFEAELEKFPSSPLYQDRYWAIAFILQLIGVVALGAYSYINAPSIEHEETSFHSEFIQHKFALAALYLLGGTFVSSIWMVLMRQYASCLVWSTLLAGAVSSAVMAGFFGYTGNFVLAGVFAVFCLLNCLYVYYVRHRIPFAVALLETVVDVIKRFPAIVGVSFLAILTQALWVTVWAFSVMYALNLFDTTSDVDDGEAAIYFLMLLSFYWTVQVIANTVLVTCNGVVAEWYFTDPGMRENPTLRAWQRAVTTSLGSICFGSFIIAMIQTLRAMVNGARKSENNFARCCVECILHCLQNIMEYVNHYAYVYVAMYGSDYCSSAKSVFTLFSHRGWSVVVNDDLIGGVVNLGGFFGGALLSLATYGVTSYFLEIDSDVVPVFAVIGFFVGLVFTYCSLIVVQSAVSCLLVCYCEDPAAMRHTKPREFDRLTYAFNKRFRNQVPMFS